MSWDSGAWDGGAWDDAEGAVAFGDWDSGSWDTGLWDDAVGSLVRPRRPIVCDVEVRVALERTPYGVPGARLPFATARMWGGWRFGQRGPDRVALGRFGQPWAKFSTAAVWGTGEPADDDIGGFDAGTYDEGVFDDDSTDAGWTDLSQAWREVTFRAGRTDPSSSFDSAEMIAHLRSDTMRFHPQNPRSDLAKSLTPGKRVQLRLRRADGTVVRLGEAISRSWKPVDEMPGTSITVLSAFDEFQTLAGYRPPALTTVDPAGYSVATRLRRIWQRCGLDGDRLDLEATTMTLQASDLAGDQLSQAKLAVESDGALWWVEPTTGKGTLRARDWRYRSPRSLTPVATFTDDPGLSIDAPVLWAMTGWQGEDLPTPATGAPVCLAAPEPLDPDTALDRVFSVLTLSRRDGAELADARPDLVALHGARSGPSRSDLDCETDDQVRELLAWRLAHAPSQLVGWQWVTIRPDMHQAARDVVERVLIHDRVRCVFHIPGAAQLGIPRISVDHFVEGVEYEIDAAGTFSARYWLSPVS